jgi:hypothetical protein
VVKLEDAYNIDDLVIAIGEAGYSWKSNGKELYKRLPFLPNPSDMFEGENSFDIYRLGLLE